MPANKCDNGKWKWGETGACKYDSKKQAEDDNSDYRAVSDIDFTPTDGMVAEAKKGKEWRAEFGRGGTEVGLKTANMIIDNELTPDRVTRMYSYLQRHEVDKQGEGFSPDEDGFPSAGRIAWALWGGDAAVKWSERKRNEIIAEQEKDERTQVGAMISDGIELPIFDTKEEAEAYAEEMGGSGSHEHIVYMPFDSHDEIMDVMNSRSIKKYNNMEKRIYNIETRIDSTDDGKEMVVGHASMYNTRSEFMGFYETIEEGAFTDELINSSDVRALINHDQNLILARNTSGTLKLEADAQGLRYEFEMPETSYGKDLAVSMKRGDITQSSFAFTVEEDDWTTDDNGNDLRTIKKIKRLYDVSPVTYPAYQDANDLTIAQRGLAEYKETLKKVDVIEEVKEEKDLVSRSLAKLKIELKKRK
jgi:hypothetical protein